jgi:ribose transport system ATP-binding protein
MASYLEMRRIVKRFPGVLALNHVDLEVRQGEIHALLGENGAGKSTLMKVLAGAYPKDEGAILIGGRNVEIRSPSHARELGISIIYQELNLIPQLSGGEHLPGRLKTTRAAGWTGRPWSGRPSRCWTSWRSRWTPAHRRGWASPRCRCRGGQGAVASIKDPDHGRTHRLADRKGDGASILRHAAAQGEGVSIIYISHHLEEVLMIADRRRSSGTRHVAVVDVNKTTIDELIRHMVGGNSRRNSPRSMCRWARRCSGSST